MHVGDEYFKEIDLFSFLRPMEASWKKPVGRYREVVQAPKKVAFISLLYFCFRLCLIGLL